MLQQAVNILLLVGGFGFVVFFHELGHFLAAKWAGVKVEQFAVGFGQALLSWRKGLGVRFGSSTKEFEKRLADGTGGSVSETEYRFNWIPLGGYVKMLGQDDLKPGVEAEDPRAFNRQSIGKRMVIVSAGVVMNVILAGIGFMMLFRMGFNAPPAVVGAVVPGSPAQQATLHVGDRILTLNGVPQHDFTKILLNVALLEEGVAVPIEVRRVDGRVETMQITPRRAEGDGKGSGFLAIGVAPPVQLKGPEVREAEIPDLDKIVGPEMLALKPGETIVAVNGEPAAVTETYKLDRAVQASNGGAVKLTVKDGAGQTRDIEVHPRLQKPFGKDEVSFGGMVPRSVVETVQPGSPVLGKVLPGDVIQSVAFKDSRDRLSAPTAKELIEKLNKAGHEDLSVTLQVVRGEETRTIADVKPSVKVAKDRFGLGIGLGYDDGHTVVAGVTENSPAGQAGLAREATILSVNGQKVQNWFDIRKQFMEARPGESIAVVANTPKDGEKTFSLALNAEQVTALKQMTLTTDLPLHEQTEVRKTTNLLTAGKWGAAETRDFILQFYVTLKRMAQGSVSPNNLMGPVGIFNAGTKLAARGPDWLLWFLAMISANLAVVNFLPIPVVDGGLFTFLILEKIQGKPLSARTQMIAQYVGLSLILGVFLFVTYQDLTR